MVEKIAFAKDFGVHDGSLAVRRPDHIPAVPWALGPYEADPTRPPVEVAPRADGDSHDLPQSDGSGSANAGEATGPAAANDNPAAIGGSIGASLLTLSASSDSVLAVPGSTGSGNGSAPARANGPSPSLGDLDPISLQSLPVLEVEPWFGEVSAEVAPTSPDAGEELLVTYASDETVEVSQENGLSEMPALAGCSCALCGSAPAKTYADPFAADGATGDGSGDFGRASSPGQAQLLTDIDGSSTVQYSGDQNLDAVLIGSRWTPTNLTFSFPTDGSFYGGSSYKEGEAGPSFFIPLNEQQKAAARYSLDLVAQYTGLTFTEITETSTTHANFRFAQSSNSSVVSSAYANFPDTTYYAGDVWFGTTGQPFYTTPDIGNWGLATMMHEIGHALGLKHAMDDYTSQNLASLFQGMLPPGSFINGTRALEPQVNGQSWSLMSYHLAPGFTSFGGEGFNQPQTFQMFDISALQFLYGANYGNNAGNTTYTFDPNTGQMFIDGVGQGTPTANKILRTIWDGNGTDTLNLSNYTTAMEIDLEPGAFSTFDTAQLADHNARNGGGAPAQGNIALARLVQGDLRSLIENATGGTGRDTIKGNQGNNHLIGGDEVAYTGSGQFNDPGNLGNTSIATARSVDGLFNQTFDADIENSTTAPHVSVTGTGNGTVRYYSFTNLDPGTEVSFDVDYGFDTSASGFDPWVRMFFPAGGFIENDDRGALDSGSTSTRDSYLKTNLGIAGTFTVAVGAWTNSGFSPIPTGGTYELQISVGGRVVAPTAAGPGDELFGADGNDTLDGGGGTDRMEGGAGDDVYKVDSLGDTVVELAGQGFDRVESTVSYALRDQSQFLESLWLTGAGPLNGTGNGLNNIIRGNDAANILNGAFGNDTLIGLDGNDIFQDDGGADRMEGGLGNDVFKVDNVGDTVIELVGQGFDRVESTVSYALRDHSQYVEALWLNGTTGIDGTGNGLNNIIRGNAANNVLNGAFGDDTLIGLGGNDTFMDDGGADRMEGGPGDDVYKVDNVGDTVIELTGQGFDRVESSVSFALRDQSQFLESLWLTGSAPIDGTGNGLNNIVRGNSANNVLNGAFGNDTLIGLGGNDTFMDDSGADRMEGGTGNDTYIVDNAGDVLVELAGQGFDKVESSISFALRDQSQHLETLLLTGSAPINGTGNGLNNIIRGNSAANEINGALGNDTLYGFAGHDVFRDDGGADRMLGGPGNDLYSVDNVNDVVVELAGEGWDVVESSLGAGAWTLPAHVEQLRLVGGASIAAYGNAEGNAIDGNSGENLIRGFKGADVLSGGAGTDTLVGGLGKDTFAFSLEDDAGIDRVRDFGKGKDRLELDAGSFVGLSPGELDTAAFALGTAASGSEERILYNSGTGVLRFDPDGSGDLPSAIFARLNGAPDLSAEDILIV